MAEKLNFTPDSTPQEAPGLGLCDPNILLTAAERVELDNDITKLQAARTPRPSDLDVRID